MSVSPTSETPPDQQPLSANESSALNEAYLQLPGPQTMLTTQCLRRDQRKGSVLASGAALGSERPIDSPYPVELPYRYGLLRMLSRPFNPPFDRFLIWVMLNPSTADSDIDDPTIRRVTDFTRRAGCWMAYVINVYAYRTMSPDILKRKRKEGFDIAGPLNRQFQIRMAAHTNATLVGAWGANADPADVQKMCTAMRSMRYLIGSDEPMLCLGHTKDGSPVHPLYQAADTPLQEWKGWSKAEPDAQLPGFGKQAGLHVTNTVFRTRP